MSLRAALFFPLLLLAAWGCAPSPDFVASSFPGGSPPALAEADAVVLVRGKILACENEGNGGGCAPVEEEAADEALRAVEAGLRAGCFKAEIVSDPRLRELLGGKNADPSRLPGLLAKPEISALLVKSRVRSVVLIEARTQTTYQVLHDEKLVSAHGVFFGWRFGDEKYRRDALTATARIYGVAGPGETGEGKQVDAQGKGQEHYPGYAVGCLAAGGGGYGCILPCIFIPPSDYPEENKLHTREIYEGLGKSLAESLTPAKN